MAVRLASMTLSSFRPSTANASSVGASSYAVVFPFYTSCIAVSGRRTGRKRDKERTNDGQREWKAMRVENCAPMFFQSYELDKEWSSYRPFTVAISSTELSRDRTKM